ncbi:MAG: hypothetical protein JXQ73_22710 [Phycisphaerae bacterium]|nr:hypothetical protein [Phycisphaerae bacterium]
MDEHSLDKLEFHRVCELLAGYCRCSLGRQLACDITPARKQPMVRRWLNQTREMIQIVEEVGLPPLAGVRDIRELVAQAVPPTRLQPEDFATIGETLAATHEIRQWIDTIPCECPTLVSVMQRVVDFKFIADQISRAIDADGQVRDNASERLARIRKSIDEAKHQIDVVLQRLLRSSHVTKMLQFPNATFHNDRIVLPLKSEHHGRLAGIIHRSSDTGATLFVEPAEVVELNNAIAKLRRDEHEEIGRILFKLTKSIHANADAVLKAVEAIGVLDVVSAKVLMAREHEMVVPEIDQGGALRLRAARHPILLAMSRADERQDLPPRPVVPIDARLGDDFDLLIVTGPNTGGKTVALKTIGLLTIMAHSGLPIPAAPGSCVPLLDDVLIDVGDEQSLQQSLSTFSSHMSRILDVLRRANARTMVLLDELGAGTDPDEGAAIGMAVIERLLSIRCPTMITTHLGTLKALGFTKERVDNAAVEFDIETLRPTYRLLIGQPGQSNALVVAAHMGMPPEMVAAAESFLPEQHKALTQAIAGTIDSRRRAEHAREEAEEAKVAAADAEADARAKAEELRRKKEDFEQWAQRVTHLKPGEVVKVLSFDRTGHIVRVNLAKQRAEVDLGNNAVEVPLSDLHPQDAPAPPPRPAVAGNATPAPPETPKRKAAPAKKTTNHKPKPVAPVLNLPAMPLEQVLALKSGQSVFVRRFQKIGQVVRVKPDKHVVVVDLGMMDAEIAFEEVCNCPERPNGPGRKPSRPKRIPPGGNNGPKRTNASPIPPSLADRARPPDPPVPQPPADETKDLEVS